MIDGLYKIVARHLNKNESIDIGGPSHMTYKDLFKQTSEVVDKRIITIYLLIIPILIIKYWENSFLMCRKKCFIHEWIA